jgi:hypothetical protein
LRMIWAKLLLTLDLPNGSVRCMHGRDGCKPYSDNDISSARISVMRRRRQLGLIFRSTP